MSSDELSIASDAEGSQASKNDDALSDGDLASEIDDLFGEDEDEEKPAKERRFVDVDVDDDDELDSGDDEGGYDRHSPELTPPPENQDLQVITLDLPRHVIPEPSDNELYLLKVPRFLAFEPTVWSARTFQPPTTEHHSKEPALSSFSAYDTALSTMRWRHSPSDPTELQSNARVLRWSDGSLTLQLATDATAQYEILAKPLAPLQQNPPKPTPLSGPQLRGRNAPSGYDASQDSFTYLGAGSASAYCVRTTNKITTALSVKPNDQANSLESLEAAMAVINAKSGGAKARTGPKIMDIRGDPEKDKLAAIEAEKQKLRAQRRLENQQNRERERSSRVLGGVSRSGRGGLTVGDLEDEEGGSGRPRISRTKSSRGNKSRRDEYSEEEEEMYGRRGGPQDNYEKDDFVVDDEDESAGDDEDAEGDEDIDDIIESREGRPSPKRSRVDDERPAQSSPTSRPKRRRVVMSDDEDE